jgi:threonine aldolase
MPSPDGRVDLRSDTVTTPTPAMRRAMAEAEVGDDVYGEDPTVNRLEELAAVMVGKEAALYVPSGTMGNQIALRLLAPPGSEVLCPARAHIRQYEAGAAARNAGVQLRPLHDRDGTFEADAVDFAAEGPGHHLPPLGLVALENTHMPAGGMPWAPAQVEAVAAAARRHGLPVHCDGARLFNAAVALGVDAAALAAPADTVMFCLSKGLSAPVGSMVAGSGDLVAAARLERARLGGGMRQAGVIAAAGIVALTEMVDRLAEDHRRARRLAEAMADRFPDSVDPDRVTTNIVCAAASALPGSFLDDLAEQGVRAGTIDQTTVRLVTHKDVDDADLDRALAAIVKAGR